MKLDRLLFLSLATSLSAMACSSSASDAEDADEGALEQQAACVDPGVDGARIADTHVTFCGDLADRAAKKGEHYESVYGQCLTLASRYKSNIANKAIACVKEGEGRNAVWDNLYSCGFSSLLASCSKDSLESKCSDLANVGGQTRWGLWTHDGKTEREAFIGECRGFLAGLEASAVTAVEKCYRDDKLPLYSCVEGLDALKGNVCIDPGAYERNPNLKASCERLLDVSSAEEGIFNRDTCVGIAIRLRANPAKTFLQGIDALAERGNVGNYDIQKLAGKVTRDVCRNTAVDATCKEIVDAATASGISNNGGRLTKECRQILAAVDAKGAEQIKSCARIQRNLAKGSPGSGNLISLYWCMSDLKASPSEL